MEERARVTAVDKDKATIEMINRSACGGCELRTGCGTGSLGRLLGFKAAPLIIPNELNLQPGDHVLLTLADRSFVLAGLLVYLLPLLMLFGMAALVELWLAAGDRWVVAAALLGLAMGLGIARWIAHDRLGLALQPRVIRRIS